MKNLLLIAIAAVLCYGCSKKSDDAPGEVNPDIVGKWSLGKDSVRTIANGVEGRPQTTGRIPDSYQFAADGTGVETFGATTVNFNFSTTSTSVTSTGVKPTTVIITTAGYTANGVNVPGGKTTYSVLNFDKLNNYFVLSYSNVTNKTGTTEIGYYTK